jgi:hypothetical protein
MSGGRPQPCPPDRVCLVHPHKGEGFNARSSNPLPRAGENRVTSLNPLPRAGRVRAFSSFLLPFALTACTATEVTTAVAPAAPGFLLGLWHGFIFPVAWIVSLFVPSVAIYAVPNNGGWYDFGYFLGVVVFGVGARKTTTVTRDRVIDVRARRIN